MTHFSPVGGFNVKPVCGTRRDVATTTAVYFVECSRCLRTAEYRVALRQQLEREQKGGAK